jgi:cell division protein FtsL
MAKFINIFNVSKNLSKKNSKCIILHQKFENSSFEQNKTFYIKKTLFVVIKKRKSSAQGTIEYLLIIAVVIVIALIVVSLFTGFFSAGGNVNKAESDIRAKTALVGVFDSAVNSDGNFILTIGNNMNDAVTVTQIDVGGDSNSGLDQQLNLGQRENIYINTSSACTSGENVVKDITIYYTTNHGINKKVIL